MNWSVVAEIFPYFEGDLSVPARPSGKVLLIEGKALGSE
jgi:hypothetical protein